MASLEAQSASGLTPLAMAAAHGRLAVAEMLLEHGVALGTRDVRGRQALHHAADRGSETILVAILHRTEPEVGE